MATMPAESNSLNDGCADLAAFHNQTTRRYSGAEPFLAGLAPSFWSHVPILAAHFNDLKLVNGLSCLIVCGHDSQQQPKLLPLSKVAIVGTIVCAERRSNGSAMYVIDDGTGLVDCLHWIENPFSLPSLTGDTHSNENAAFRVGSLVKVLGRIECLSIHAEETALISVCDQSLRYQKCTREVHATVVQELLAVDGESRHWLACQSLLKSNLNASQALAKLGPEIQKQVDDRENLPSADDSCSEWRLFGTKCRCNLAYKQSLLYCHCHATMEPLDPNLEFRDRLLIKLTALERTAPNMEPFRVQYKYIVDDEELQSVALQVVGYLAGARRLVSSTVRALRKDGILYLLCPDSDTYLLISEKRVLKPYLQKLMSREYNDAVERAALQAKRPEYLVSVPKARIELAKRRLFREQTEKT